MVQSAKKYGLGILRQPGSTYLKILTLDLESVSVKEGSQICVDSEKP